jgi:hypothetical protein
MANEVSKLKVTVFKGLGRGGRDEEGNATPRPTYYTARLSLAGSKAYINVSDARAPILVAAGVSPNVLARVSKAREDAAKRTKNDPGAKVTTTNTHSDSEVASF